MPALAPPLLLLLAGCGALVDSDFTGDGPVALIGAAEKGPFVRGSAVTVSPVDADGLLTGETYPASTLDDLGAFSVSLDHVGGVRLEASGYAWNEATAALSSGPMTLRGWHEIDAAGEQVAYLNVLTHLAHDRVAVLVADGAALDEAVATAESEVFDALGLGRPDAGAAREWSLAGGADPDGDAYLFAASALLAHAGALRADDAPDQVDARTQELLNLLAQDLADGSLEATYADELAAAQRSLDSAWIRGALQARLDALGADAMAPDLDAWLDRDGDGVPNADDTCPLQDNPDQDVIPSGPCGVDWGVASAPSDWEPDLDFGIGGTTGDLDGDGVPDALVLRRTGLDAWRGDGDVGLSRIGPSGAASYQGQYALGDLDGDGWADLVRYDADAGGGMGSVTVAPGLGDGTFGESTGWMALSLQLVEQDVRPRIADVDGDGAADILVQNCVLWGEGDGTGDGTTCVDEAMLLSWTAGDLDEDGDLELLALAPSFNWSRDAVLLWPGAGGDPRSFEEEVVGDEEDGGMIDREAHIADFDGDGAADLLLVAYDSTLRLLLGDGTGGLTDAGTAAFDGQWYRTGAAPVDLGDEVLLVGGDVTGTRLAFQSATGDVRHSVDLPVGAAAVAPAGDGGILVVLADGRLARVAAW